MRKALQAGITKITAKTTHVSLVCNMGPNKHFFDIDGKFMINHMWRVLCRLKVYCI